MMKLRHLLSANDLSLEEINQIFKCAMSFELSSSSFSNSLSNKFLALMFFEPSTRTRFSFEAAFKKLGGNVLDFSDPSRTAIGKGESFIDTIKVIQNYSDIIVIRHPIVESVKLASEHSDVPVVNAGNGTHEHPTQALTDLYTIKNLKGKIDGLKIAICGDLKNGRDIHSLCLLLANYNVELFLIAPQFFQVPDFVLQALEIKKFKKLIFLDKLESLKGKVDVLYLNRIQKERIKNRNILNKNINFHKITKRLVPKFDSDTIILNPLPRSHEIPLWFDADPRAKYFIQAKNGLWVRMALFYLLFGKSSKQNQMEK